MQRVIKLAISIDKLQYLGKKYLRECNIQRVERTYLRIIYCVSVINHFVAGDDSNRFSTKSLGANFRWLRTVSYLPVTRITKLEDN